MKSGAWNLKVLALVFLVFMILMGTRLAVAQDSFPSRPINVIVGWAPGGSVDIGVRIVSKQVGEELGASIVVLNKPGGGGMVGSEFVRASKPDGYTLLGTSIGLVTIPIIDPKSPYIIDDFIPICRHIKQDNLAAVRSESPFKTIQEVIDFVKKNPGRLSYGTSGIGSTGHFFGELFKQTVGLEMTHVPFKGDSLILSAMIGGHVDLGMPTLPGAISLMKGGKVRALVLASTVRNPEAPEIPTIVEIGYPTAVMESWHGFVAPKGTPQPVLDKLSAAFEKANKNPSVQNQLKQTGLIPAYLNPVEFKEFMKQQREILKKVAAKAGMILKD